MTDFPPVRPPARPAAPGTAPDPGPGASHQGGHTGRALLLGAAAVVLLAGLVWGIVTATRSRPGSPSPTGPATSQASPMTAAQQARYQVTRVRMVTRPRGARIQWNSPPRTSGLTAFIVVAELGGRAQQEHTVGSAGRSAVFVGLRSGRRYCFVVGTVIESANGQAGTATAAPVCKVIR